MSWISVRSVHIVVSFVTVFAAICSGATSAHAASFLDGRSYPAGSGSRAMVLIDLNGDGRKDIATADDGGGTVSVLLADGDGSFHAPVHYAVGSGPRSVAYSDLNNDGTPDLVAANDGGNSLSVLLGNGNGTFHPGATIALGSSPSSVISADLNGDGMPDLATASFDDNKIMVLLGRGDGTFETAVNYTCWVGPHFIITGDLNGDGNADLVTSNFSSLNMSVFLNNGDGTFQAPLNADIGVSPYGAAMADLNGDGKQDLAVAAYTSNSAAVLLGNGNGTFQVAVRYAAGEIAAAVAARDLDGDGILDLAVANSNSGTVSVLSGGGDGTFHKTGDYNSGSQPMGLAADDLNADGIADLATVNWDGNAVVLLGFGGGSFPSAAHYAAETGTFDVVAGDLDGDGIKDLAAANYNSSTVSVFLGSGSGAFQAAVNYAVNPGPRAVTIDDFNKDGIPDLATADSSWHTISVLLGAGSGTFLPAVHFSADAQSYSAPYSVTSADVNSDGNPDLVAANYSSGNIAVHLGSGNGTFLAPVSYPTGSGLHAVIAPDLNGDGVADLAAVSYTGNAVAVLLGNGDGTFQARVEYPAGANPASLTASDFNGDGKKDIAVANLGSSDVSLLLGNGDGTLRTAVNYSTDRGARDVVAGDFNADGKMDLASANYHGDSVSVLMGGGTGTFSAAVNYVSAIFPCAIVAEDLNGDNKPDLVLANTGTNDVAVMLNTMLRVSASAGPNGSISCAPVMVDPHEGAACTITPHVGYAIDAVTGCGGSLAGTMYTIAAVQSDCTVQVSFMERWRQLSVSVSGPGSVTSSPAGIDCGSACSASFGNGAPVALTTAPAAGQMLTGWSGDCSGIGTCLLTMDADRSVTATFGAITPASGAAVAPDLASPQPVSTPVIFTAAGSGGTGTYQYQFLYKLSTAPTWSTAQAYSSSNTWTWTTDGLPVGSYSIQMRVRNAGSKAAYEAMKTVGFKLVAPSATGAALEADPASPRVTGTAVTFTAGGIGGSGVYQYQFLYKLGTAPSWTTGRGYALSNTWSWSTGGLAAGTYSIQIRVRSAGNTSIYEAMKTVSYKLTPPPATGATLAASPASPQSLGAGITFTAGATGGEGPYQYQFLYKLSTAPTWSTGQGYGLSNTWLWNTASFAAGNYLIQVRARSFGSAATYEAMKTAGYRLVVAPVSSVTISSSPTGSQVIGEPATFTAAAAGGGPNIEYQFLYRLSTVPTWTIGQDYSPSALWTWNTAGFPAGSYAVQVRARNYGSPADHEALQSLDYALAKLAPNMLFAIDMSGSMAWPAYSYLDVDGNGDGVLDNYDPGAFYDGYFDRQKSYKLVSGTYEETVPTGEPCTQTCISWICRTTNIGGCDPQGSHGCGSRYACCSSWQTTGDCGVVSGNYLNYAAMTRIDLLRWALTGGRPASCVGANVFIGGYCDPEVWAEPGNEPKVGSACNDSLDADGDAVADGGCILLAGDGTTKVKVRWERITGVNPVAGITGSNFGLLYQVATMPDAPRLGALFFSDSGVRTSKVYLGDFVGANSKTTYSYYNLITAVNSHDPAGFTPTGPALWDAFNYFAMEPPQYGGFPEQIGSGDRWKNPMYACQNGGLVCEYHPERENHVLLLSDGQWNQGGYPGTVTTTCSIDMGNPFSADPVVPAYQMHQGFLNVATGMVTRVRATYAVGLFLSGPPELSMKNVAMYGSFNNASRTWPGSTIGYPATSCSVDSSLSCSGNAAKGSSCTALPVSSADWDANGDGMPDTFLPGNSATQIKDAIMGAVLDSLTE